MFKTLWVLQIIYQMLEQLVKNSPYEVEVVWSVGAVVNADDGNFDNLLEGVRLATGLLVAGLVPASDEMIERELGWAVGLSLDGLLGWGVGLAGGLPLGGLQFLIKGLPIRK